MEFVVGRDSDQSLGDKKFIRKPSMVAHTFNPSTQEAEAGGSLSSRLAWCIE